MKILYVSPKSAVCNLDNLMRKRGHAVVWSSNYTDALEILRRNNLDAVVIEDEDESLEVRDFTDKVHRVHPEVPVFLAGDWGADLPDALESLEQLRTADSALRALVELQRQEKKVRQQLLCLQTTGTQ